MTEDILLIRQEEFVKKLVKVMKHGKQQQTVVRYAIRRRLILTAPGARKEL